MSKYLTIVMGSAIGIWYSVRSIFGGADDNGQGGPSMLSSLMWYAFVALFFSFVILTVLKAVKGVKDLVKGVVK